MSLIYLVTNLHTLVRMFAEQKSLYPIISLLSHIVSRFYTLHLSNTTYSININDLYIGEEPIVAHCINSEVDTSYAHTLLKCNVWVLLKSKPWHKWNIWNTWFPNRVTSPGQRLTTFRQKITEYLPGFPSKFYFLCK